MIPELLALLAGAAGVTGWGGRWWWRRTQRDHVIRIGTAWVRAGQRIHYTPVGAVCYGHRPPYRQGVFGALGLTDGQIVFDGHRARTYNTGIPFQQVRWIGLSTIRTTLHTQRALMIHHDSTDGWRASAFIIEAPVELAHALSRECDLPVHDAGSERADYGPAPATRMTQDVYGEWSPDREGDLYLAPDRLLFAWRSAIPLDRIQRLDVLTQGDALNPLSHDLLRIEHESGDGDIDVTGFVVRRASHWADALQHRAAAPIRVFAGRKKKD
jgi:hypothetical protein